MIPDNVTAETIITRVRALAAAHPTAAYDNGTGGAACYYTRGTVRLRDTGDVLPRVGCIMGQVLHDLAPGALPDETLGGTPAHIAEVLSAAGIPAHHDARLWLLAVQSHQDCGHTWAAAVAYADHLYSTDEDQP
jgi:hypothetical protein